MSTSGSIVRGIYEAFARADGGAVFAAFDPQIEWREAEGFLFADGNPYVGPQAIADGVFQRLVDAIDDFSIQVTRYIDGGDVVVAEGRYRGTMKATGVALDAPFAHVWDLRGGRVVRFQQYTDTHKWQQAANSRQA